VIILALVDNIFIANARNILDTGIWDTDQNVRPRWADDNAPAHTIKVFSQVNRYDLSVEFPALTLRKLPFKSCIDEILWIWQKKSNNIKELGSKIWDAWADEDGSIGKAYGYQLGLKHKFSHGETDQVDNLLWTLKNNPACRRMVTSIFNHADLHAMGLSPCVWSVTLNVTGKRLNMLLNQRSQDFVVANNWNVAQYAILLHMFAQVSGFEVGELVHVIADNHVYDRHVPILEELITREPLAAPKLIVNPDVKDFYGFTVDDFKLEGYVPHEFKVKLPVAV
jgi:thymidylate synthase